MDQVPATDFGSHLETTCEPESVIFKEIEEEGEMEYLAFDE